MPRLLFFSLIGVVSLLTISLGAAAGSPAITLAPALAPQSQALHGAIQRAQDRLNRFAARHGWQPLLTSLVDEIVIYDTKAAFDRALLSRSGSAPDTRLPASYVGTVVNRQLLAVSPAVYAKVQDNRDDPDAWEKLLTHELAHQLHVDILQGHEDRMGPVWFYEGFAAVAADQYVDDLPRLSQAGRQYILAELRRGSYRNYEALLRYYMQTVPLPELVRHAGEPDFLAWLTGTFHDVPTPAPTHADIYKRSM